MRVRVEPVQSFLIAGCYCFREQKIAEVAHPIKLLFPSN